jgi:hypothetical protein
MKVLNIVLILRLFTNLFTLLQEGTRKHGLPQTKKRKKCAKEECTSVWRVPNNLPGSKWKRGGRLPWNPLTT